VSTAPRAAIFRSFRQFTTVPRRHTTTSSDSRRRHGPSSDAGVASEAASDVPEAGRTEVHDSDDSVASQTRTHQ